jgi:predicted cobalt transporter CbtA
MSFVNEAGWDRVARVVAGVVLLAVGFGAIGGTVGTVLGVVGLIPLLTGLIGYCPIYSLLHVRTNHPDERSTTA